MDFTLHIWRQANVSSRSDSVSSTLSSAPGRLETHKISGITPDTSFIEMLDMLNARLIEEGKEPFAFESDCLEGICGTCSLMINGIAHGPEQGVTTCQLFMRSFADGDSITVEPWRSKSFPILKDLAVDRSAFDRIIQAGGFISVRTGGTPDANALPVPKNKAETAMDAAQCIGCGACVASCKNGSAMLFVAAKVSHFANLPQGQVEASRRARRMVAQMDHEGFGNCTNQYECEAVCPKEISVKFIGQLNRELLKAALCHDED